MRIAGEFWGKNCAENARIFRVSFENIRNFKKKFEKTQKF